MNNKILYIFQVMMLRGSIYWNWEPWFQSKFQVALCFAKECEESSPADCLEKIEILLLEDVKRSVWKKTDFCKEIVSIFL